MAPGPAWWDPVWEHGLQQLCCSIFLPYGPERFGEFLASQAAFQAVGDRGWLAILYAQCLDHLEFAGADTTRQTAGGGCQHQHLAELVERMSVPTGRARPTASAITSRAIRELSQAVAYQQGIGDSSHGAELRFLAISQCEVGHLDEAAELVLSAFDLAGSDRSERETQRTLAAASYVLEAAGQPELAAAAVGRAAPYQDNFVDTLGTVGKRLRADLGDERADVLMRAGAGRDLVDLVGEVRTALVSIAT